MGALPVQALGGASQLDSHGLRLPWRFEVAAVHAEALGLPAQAWEDHFNTGAHNGGWQACALRSAQASPLPTAPGEFAQEAYADTALMARCPAIRQLVARMDVPAKSVRLMRLQPGGEIFEHVDPHVGLRFGEARLHVPLQTSERVFFYVEDQRIPMRAGEAWYVDVSRRHRVINRSDTARIHLVVDCLPNDALLAAIRAADTGEPLAHEGDPVQAFEQFRERVFAQPALQSELLCISGRQEFLEVAVKLGRENGFDFTSSEVQSAMNAGRRAWIEQWIV